MTVSAAAAVAKSAATVPVVSIPLSSFRFVRTTSGTGATEPDATPYLLLRPSPPSGGATWPDREGFQMPALASRWNVHVRSWQIADCCLFCLRPRMRKAGVSGMSRGVIRKLQAGSAAVLAACLMLPVTAGAQQSSFPTYRAAQDQYDPD